MTAPKTPAKKRGPGKGNRSPNRGTVADHKPDCPCVVCQPPRQGRSTKLVRLPIELVDWANERGGVASVLRQAKASE